MCKLSSVHCTLCLSAVHSWELVPAITEPPITLPIFWFRTEWPIKKWCMLDFIVHVVSSVLFLPAFQLVILALTLNIAAWQYFTSWARLRRRTPAVCLTFLCLCTYKKKAHTNTQERVFYYEKAPFYRSNMKWSLYSGCLDKTLIFFILNCNAVFISHI